MTYEQPGAGLWLRWLAATRGLRFARLAEPWIRAHVVTPPRNTRTMPYDHDLANQLREALQGEQGLTERAMFGGIAFLINGHLAISASSQGGLLLRVDPSQSETLLEQPHAQRFVMRGRQLDGWLRIDGSGLMTDDDVGRWVSIGVKYARSLPQK